MLALSPISLTTYSNAINTNPVISYSGFSNPLTMASFYYPENPILTVVNRIADGTVTSGWGKGQACSGLMAAIDRFFGWGICSQQATEDTSSLQKRHIYQVTNFTYEMTNGTRCDIVEKPPIGTDYSYAVEIAALNNFSNKFRYLQKTCSFYSSSLSFLYDSQKTHFPYVFESGRCQYLSTGINRDLKWEARAVLECEILEQNPMKEEINQTIIQYEIPSHTYKNLTYLLKIVNDLPDGQPTNAYQAKIIRDFLYLRLIQKWESYETSWNVQLKQEDATTRLFFIIALPTIAGLSIILSLGFYFSTYDVMCGRRTHSEQAKKLPNTTDTAIIASELDPNEIVVIASDEETSSRV